MKQPQPSDYFKRRAEEERAAAEQAADERAAQSHRELSDHYEQLARGAQLPTEVAPESHAAGIVSREFRIVP
jgi:hypothetical protein